MFSRFSIDVLERRGRHLLEHLGHEAADLRVAAAHRQRDLVAREPRALAAARAGSRRTRAAGRCACRGRWTRPTQSGERFDRREEGVEVLELRLRAVGGTVAIVAAGLQPRAQRRPHRPQRFDAPLRAAAASTTRSRAANTISATPTMPRHREARAPRAARASAASSSRRASIWPASGEATGRFGSLCRISCRVEVARSRGRARASSRARKVSSAFRSRASPSRFTARARASGWIAEQRDVRHDGGLDVARTARPTAAPVRRARRWHPSTPAPAPPSALLHARAGQRAPREPARVGELVLPAR